MKHKTINRLLIKLMGVFFLVNGICGLFASAVYLLIVFSDATSSGDTFFLAYPTSALIGSGLMFVAGLLFLVASNWLVSKLIPSNRPYCPNCGYELTGLVRPDCPECGVVLPKQKYGGLPDESRQA